MVERTEEWEQGKWAIETKLYSCFNTYFVHSKNERRIYLVIYKELQTLVMRQRGRIKGIDARRKNEGGYEKNGKRTKSERMRERFRLLILIWSRNLLVVLVPPMHLPVRPTRTRIPSEPRVREGKRLGVLLSKLISLKILAFLPLWSIHPGSVVALAFSISSRIW